MIMNLKARISIITLLIFSFVFIQAHAQEEEVAIPNYNVVKLDIVWILGENFYFSYERILSEESSLQFGLLAGDSRVVGSFSYRYYLSEAPAPKGPFIAPIVGLGGADGVVFGAGLLIGSQGYFKQKITLDAYIGPIYGTDGSNSGFTIFGGVNVGIAF